MPNGQQNKALNTNNELLLDILSRIVSVEQYVRSYGELRFQGNNLTTTITTPGEYVNINALFDIGPMNNFRGFSNGKLVYTGDTTKMFKIQGDWSWRISIGGNSETGSVGLFINDVLVPYSSISSTINDTGNNNPKIGSMSTFVTLDPEDIIQLRVANITDTDDIDFIDMTSFNVTEM